MGKKILLDDVVLTAPPGDLKAFLALAFSLEPGTQRSNASRRLVAAYTRKSPGSTVACLRRLIKANWIKEVSTYHEKTEDKKAFETYEYFLSPDLATCAKQETP